MTTRYIRQWRTENHGLDHSQIPFKLRIEHNEWNGIQIALVTYKSRGPMTYRFNMKSILGHRQCNLQRSEYMVMPRTGQANIGNPHVQILVTWTHR